MILASIERTAYPRFKRSLTQKELEQVYTPTWEEMQWIQQTGRGTVSILNVAVLLKCFQKLGYFPRLSTVPSIIVAHIRQCLHLNDKISPGYDNKRTLYRHFRSIRDYLQIRPYGKDAQRIAIDTIRQAARVKDHPADLVNVAIAELVNQYYELPAFSTLDRLARRLRRLVNETFFQQVLDRLSKDNILQLDVLIQQNADQFYSDYHRLKQLPKKPRLSHIQEQINQLQWLTTFEDVRHQLKDIPPAKVLHFAAQAKVLDAQELRDYAAPKRYT